jgi:DNA-binding Lrp family transcriptional regulator
MTQSLELDAIDWKILRELQSSGRISNVDLAERVGLSPPPCLRRVRALEDRGVIEGYRALLNANALGFGVQLFAMVGLKSQSEAALTDFEARIKAWPLVREAFALSGENDFILKCIARDLATMQEFVIKELTAAPNVDHVKTTLILRVAKYQPGLPIT